MMETPQLLSLGSASEGRCRTRSCPGCPDPARGQGQGSLRPLQTHRSWAPKHKLNRTLLLSPTTLLLREKQQPKPCRDSAPAGASHPAGSGTPSMSLTRS